MYIDFTNGTIDPFYFVSGTNSSNLSVVNNELSIMNYANFDLGTFTVAPSTNIVGRFEIQYNFTYAGDQRFSWDFMGELVGQNALKNGYGVIIDTNLGTLKLYKTDNNESKTVLASASISSLTNTNMNIITVERDLNGRIEVFWNKTSILVHTDTTYTVSNYMGFNFQSLLYMIYVRINYVLFKDLSPISSFNAAKTSNPLEVQFIPSVTEDTDAPISYLWDFGDGYTATTANPVHTYLQGSTFSITLTTSNRFGSSDPYNLTKDVPLGVFFFNDSNDNTLSNILFESAYPNTKTNPQLINVGSKNWNITDVVIEPFAVDNSQIPLPMQKSSINTYKFIELTEDKETYSSVLDIASVNADSYDPIYIRANIPNYAVTGNFLCGLIGTVHYSGPLVHGYTAWSKYTTIPITGSVDETKYNYPVHVIIEYASHMNADFSDLRFTLNDGYLLSHEIAYKEDSNFAEFVIKIPKLYQSPYITHIFAVSGNSSATDISNPANVYDFFDDFADLTKWNVTGNVTVDDGLVNIAYNNANASITQKLSLNIAQYIVTVKYKQASANHNLGYLTYDTRIANPNFWTPLSFDYGQFNPPKWNGVAEANNLSNNAWYLWKWINNANGYGWQITSEDGNTTLVNESTTPLSGLNALAFVATDSSDSNFSLDWVKIEQTTQHPPVVGEISGWKDNTITGTDTETIILQGMIFSNSPENPPKPDQNILFSVDGNDYPKWENFKIDIRNNDSASTFNVTYLTDEDLPLYSSQEITFKEQFGDPQGFYSGVINNVNDHNEPANRSYTIKGINNASDLVVQPFSIAASTTNQTLSTSLELIDLILQNTNIKLGPCPNIAVTGIVNDNMSYNGFAGNWNTKADALTDLCTLISNLLRKNISWFVDDKKLLHLFYTNVVDPSVGVIIRNDNPRRTIIEIEDSCENVINDQVGTGGANNELYVHMQDSDSINGFTDENTGITWPALGVQTGQQIQDSSILTQSDLNARVQREIDLHSKRVFVATITLSRFPDVQIGQPLYLPDNYKVRGMTFVITQITYNGKSGDRSMTIVATTDPAMVGPLSINEQINVLAQTAIQQYTPEQAVVTELPSEGNGNTKITVKPANQQENINVTNIAGKVGN